jgi:hypothetical protein
LSVARGSLQCSVRNPNLHGCDSAYDGDDHSTAVVTGKDLPGEPRKRALANDNAVTNLKRVEYLATTHRCASSELANCVRSSPRHDDCRAGGLSAQPLVPLARPCFRLCKLLIDRRQAKLVAPSKDLLHRPAKFLDGNPRVHDANDGVGPVLGREGIWFFHPADCGCRAAGDQE